MITKATIAAAALALALTASAQSRRMAILDMPASPQALALGSSALGANGGIYADPAVALFGTEATAIDYNFALTDDNTGRTGLHTISATHRTGNDMLLVGARYFAQGRLGREIDIDMKPVGDGRRLYSYMADAGYGHRFGQVGVYGSVGIASEKTTLQTTACRLNLGAAWHGHAGRTQWIAGAAVRDLGFAVADNKNHALAPLAHAGGRLTVPTWGRQSLTAVIDGGAYLPLDDNKTAGTFGGGLAYSFARSLTIGVGAHTGDSDDFVGTGFSLKVGIVSISAAVKFAMSDGLDDVYMVGAGVSF